MTPERFDIYDDHRQWIGTAPRNEVHAKGYWHRSFHCWIVRDEESKRMVLFQRRRDIKDTFRDITTSLQQVTLRPANRYRMRIAN